MFNSKKKKQMEEEELKKRQQEQMKQTVVQSAIGGTGVILLSALSLIQSKINAKTLETTTDNLAKAIVACTKLAEDTSGGTVKIVPGNAAGQQIMQGGAQQPKPKKQAPQQQQPLAPQQSSQTN